MVLVTKLILFILLSSSTSLFETYHKEINSTIKGLFKGEQIDYQDKPYPFGEIREILIGGQNAGYLLISEVATCNLGGCQIKGSNENLDSESFDMLVVISPNNEVLSIKILDYFSDYGYEITARKYLKKFIGKNICDFSKKVDGIDGISGATISCNALENSLSLLCEH